MAKSTLQSRTASRAKRLGLAPIEGTYTRGQARSIKRQLRTKRAGGQPGPLNSGSPSGGAQAPSGGTSAPSKPRKPLTSLGKTGINRVTSGPGSARQGKSYQVKQGPGGAIFHVYGRGKAAVRKRVRKSVAQAYGETE